MTTATAPTATTNTAKTYERTAKEEREYNLQINGDKPLVEVKGTNTYPIKGWLFTLGGKWNKETNTWWVPEHTHQAAQAKADELTAKASTPKAPKAAPAPAAKVEAKPAVTITAAQVVAAAAPAPVPTDRLVFRLNNLLGAATDLSKQVTDAATSEALTLAIDALTLAGQNALAAASK